MLWERERDAFLTKHSELQDKLQKLKSEMGSVQGKLAESETSRAASEQEMKLWRKSANRYKKKVREQRHSICVCRCGQWLRLSLLSIMYSRQRPWR